MTFAAADMPTAGDFNDIAPRFAYKALNETVNNSAVIQSDDELFLTVAASTKYAFELYMLYNTNTTANIKIGWTLPTGATNAYRAAYYNGSAWIAAGASTVPTTGLAVNGFAGDLPFYAHGSISVSTTAGSLQVVWAQNTANASNTTVYAASYLRLQKIA